LDFACRALAAAASDAVLPTVPAGFKVELVAREPLVRNPCAMVFDARGRLFVGQGPQYRNPKPDTPGDTIEIMIDRDGDGIFDANKTFARGLNRAGPPGTGAILGPTRPTDHVRDPMATAWRTNVRVCCERHIGTLRPELGARRRALSKGTSRTPRRRIAPSVQELGCDRTPGTPDLPNHRARLAERVQEYVLNPADDWGKEGESQGDDMGRIWCPRMQSMDVAFDHGFNGLNDNDQYDGDRVMMPFYGAHRLGASVSAD
jgi:hypothetical protein